ncbi:MAG: helix-turn-helix domain-containing protein [Chitinophagaceae bacterium]
MQKTILIISLPIEDLQTVIIDCVNSCLKNNKHTGNQDLLESDQLLTIQQAAELLKLSVPTIYGLVSKSELPVNKRGKRLYFSKQELTDWVKQGRKKTQVEIQAEADTYIHTKKRRG